MTARRGPLDGAANNAAGLKWQRDCAMYLRDHGFPLAASARRGVDLAAGPAGIDATIIEWDKIPAKIDKTIVDCGLAGLPFAAVWKKRNRKPGQRNMPGDAGSTDPARGIVQMRGDHFVGLLGELEAARERAAAAERDLERWMARERAG